MFFNNDDEDEHKPQKSSPWPVLITLGLIFLPGVILTWLLWAMFRWGRQRTSVVGLAALVSAALGVVISVLAWGNLTAEGISFDTLGQATTPLIFLWVGVSLVVGSLAGWGFTFFSAQQMRRYPYLTTLAGDWRYRFKYRRTPWEYFRRKKRIEGLKEGAFITPEAAPLGMDEDTDEVVYRFDSEARKHTFITGASGSGKAIHKDTLIPTQGGFIRAGDIEPGMVGFDQEGNPTRFLKKFQPMTKDHYLLSFSNGEEVKACGDHLWTVKEAGSLKPRTVTTRELALRPQDFYISSLRKPILGISRLPVNATLLGAWLGSGTPEKGIIPRRDLLSEAPTAYESFEQDLRSLKLLDRKGLFTTMGTLGLTAATPVRERILEGAISIAGSYTLAGEIKLTLQSQETGEYLRSLVFSLGIQPSPLESREGTWTFTFRKTPKKSGGLSFGAAAGRRAPLRGLIKIEKVVPLEDKPEDYFCFTVDSPEHLFLIGKSFLPTHNTITMQNLILTDIENGKTVVVVDFKRSPKFASKLAAWANENDREFYHFVNGEPEDYDIPFSKGQCLYDPLKTGSLGSKADMVLGMREYDTNAAVYKAAMQQFLQIIFPMLEYADRSKVSTVDWDHGWIYKLASAVRGNAPEELAAANMVQVPPGSGGHLYTLPGSGGPEGPRMVYVNSPVAQAAAELVEDMRGRNSALAHARDELQGQMRTITASAYGRWMRTSTSPEDREIDLKALTEEGGNVVLFSLNSDSEPDFSRYVGSLIFSDLTNISADRRNSGATNQVNVYVDEFQAVPPTSVTSLLEKSRESAIALTLAQQSFDQVVASAANAGEAYLTSILDTCSNFIAHAGATEKSANRLAEILGKHFETIYSKANSNDSSFLSINWSRSQSSKVTSREEERWVFHPKEFMGLSSPDKANGKKSSMVWVTKTTADPKYAGRGGATARKVWVIPKEEVLKEIYNPEIAQEARKTNKLKVAEKNASQLDEQLTLLDDTPEDFYPNPEPPEDEEWTFEDIEEEEQPLTLPSLPPEEPEYDIGNLFSGDALPPVTPTPPEPPKTTGGLPPRPGGIPTRPVNLPPRKPLPPEERENISLPELF